MDFCCCSSPACRLYGCQNYRHPTWIPNPVFALPTSAPGCICPPTSEQTCQNPVCPREAYSAVSVAEAEGDKR